MLLHSYMHVIYNLCFWERVKRRKIFKKLQSLQIWVESFFKLVKTPIHLPLDVFHYWDSPFQRPFRAATALYVLGLILTHAKGRREIVPGPSFYYHVSELLGPISSKFAKYNNTLVFMCSSEKLHKAICGDHSIQPYFLSKGFFCT